MNENTIEKMLAALTPEIVAAMKLAIEISKWPDGRRITPEQRATCMQAIIAWEFKHLPENQRTGYIDKGEKKSGDVCDADHAHEENAESTVRFLH